MNIHGRSLYAGKIRDRSQHIEAAGKLTALGDTAELCLKPSNGGQQSQPDPGRRRFCYGNNPILEAAENMTHGVSTQSSESAKVLVNPKSKTLFEQRLENHKEGVYASLAKGPLGKSHDQKTGLPANLHPEYFTFGLPTELDIGAGGLINPEKTYEQVDQENAVGHRLYVKTHSDFDVGERINRSYTCPSFNPNQKYGIPTPHCNDGKEVSQTLKWLQQEDKMSKMVSQRVDNFRERTQPCLGKVHDPIKDTLKVAAEHTFGVLFKPDEFGAGDLLHNRFPGLYLRGRDRQRGVVSAARQHLKKVNYHNFPDLLTAFRFYDKDGSGKISIEGLRNVCIEFNLPLEPEILEQVFDYCDVNRDGKIDYVEFSNFLNWKDKMESGFPFENGLSTDVEKEAEKSPVTSESTPRRLKKQIDMAVGNHKTSSGMINAVVGGVSAKGYRTYGVPTIRSDLPAPRIRRIADRKNYGDESDCYGLLNPSVYSSHGVFEKDFLISRSEAELKHIFERIGVKMTGETFENVYKIASSSHPTGHVNVESFRNVLDTVQAFQIESKQHPLAI